MLEFDKYGWARVFCAFALALPVAATAQPTTLGAVGETAENDGRSQWITNTLTFNNNETVQHTGTHTFAGIDGQDSSASMSLQYASKAQSGTAGLKTAVQGTLTTPFYNPSNLSYLDYGSIGVPTGVSVDAQAMLADRLSVVGASGLAYVTATIELDGSNIGLFTDSAVFGNAYAYVQDAGGFLFNSTADTISQAFNLTLTSHRFAVSNGGIDFYLNLASSVDFNIAGDSQETYSGSVDFFNTVKISGFSGWDASGNAVDLYTVSGSDGYQYLAPVPEPEQYALFVMGMGFVALSVRRRQSKTH